MFLQLSILVTVFVNSVTLNNVEEVSAFVDTDTDIDNYIIFFVVAGIVTIVIVGDIVVAVVTVALVLVIFVWLLLLFLMLIVILLVVVLPVDSLQNKQEMNTFG